MGRVARVTGPVVDVEFPDDAMPELFNALKVEVDFSGEARTLTLEVAQHIGDNLVRVRVRWPYLDANSREIGAESSDYTIARDAHGKLKLRIALLRGIEHAPEG